MQQQFQQQESIYHSQSELDGILSTKNLQKEYGVNPGSLHDSDVPLDGIVSDLYFHTQQGIPVQMSASVKPDGGLYTEQGRGEIYTPEQKKEVSKLPNKDRKRVTKNVELMQELSDYLDEFDASEEGIEHKNYLSLMSGRKYKTIERIGVEEIDSQVVAKTYPFFPKGNIVVNSKFFDQYVAEVQKTYKDLNRQDIASLIAVHEDMHYNGQTTKILTELPEPVVEYHNDVSNVIFYLARAYKNQGKDSKDISKARFFMHRYPAEIKNKINSLIDETVEKIKNGEKISVLEEIVSRIE